MNQKKEHGSENSGHTPKVTVLMPVHNGERYLHEAIRSILSQSFTDFEFLIIDDGSADQSVPIIESYDDPRIVLKHNPTNRGTMHVLNDGLDSARGDYIVRMDCDDISLPGRLEMQVRFMDANPKIGISGGGMQLIKKGKLRNKRTFPQGDNELKITLLFHTCFFHPTVIIRRSAIDYHRYPDNLVYTQDYNFWVAMADKTGYANLDTILLHFRLHEEQISSRKADLQQSNARLIRQGYVTRLFPETAGMDMELHHRIAENRNDLDLHETSRWLEFLVDLNRKHEYFPAEVFNRELSRRWWHCCKKNRVCNAGTLKQYTSSALRHYYRPPVSKYLRFTLKCLLMI